MLDNENFSIRFIGHLVVCSDTEILLDSLQSNEMHKNKKKEEEEKEHIYTRPSSSTTLWKSLQWQARISSSFMPQYLDTMENKLNGATERKLQPVSVLSMCIYGVSIVNIVLFHTSITITIHTQPHQIDPN